LGLLGLLLGTLAGSSGWQPARWLWDDTLARQIVLDIRLPRSLGAWLAGALLGLAGALAQGLFRNPLADPFLLGSASGATLAVCVWLSLVGAGASLAQSPLGPTGAAFVGALGAVLLTVALSRGVQDALRGKNTDMADNERIRAFLMALRDPKVVEMASQYGNPKELLETFVE
jgi:iron complex transport system permease protein